MDKKSKMNMVLIVVFVFIFGGYQIWSMFHENYPIVNYPPKGSVIVAFGDSLTEGVGASSPDKGYVPLLEERLGITIVNKGVSGNTSEQALARIDDILALKPNAVLVFLGGNDMLQRIPKETTFKNLTTIIERIHKAGAVVILIGLDGLIGNGYRDEFDTLARSTGSMYVPNIMEGIIGNKALLSDEIHPNDAGYLKIADRIAFTLEGVTVAMPKEVAQGFEVGTDTVRTSPASE